MQCFTVSCHFSNDWSTLLRWALTLWSTAKVRMTIPHSHNKLYSWDKCAVVIKNKKKKEKKALILINNDKKNNTMIKKTMRNIHMKTMSDSQSKYLAKLKSTPIKPSFSFLFCSSHCRLYTIPWSHCKRFFWKISNKSPLSIRGFFEKF